jgi:hypothetical protein
MTDKLSCVLFSKPEENRFIALLITSQGEGSIIVEADDVIDDKELHQLRIDKRKPWSHVGTYQSAVIFYNGPVGTETWKSLVQEFKSGTQARINFHEWHRGLIDQTFSLVGFTKAYENFKKSVKQKMGFDVGD